MTAIRSELTARYGDNMNEYNLHINTYITQLLCNITNITPKLLPRA